MAPFFDLFRRSPPPRYPARYPQYPPREMPPDVGVNVKILGGFQFEAGRIYYRLKVKNLSEDPLGKVEAVVKFTGDPLGEFLKDNASIPMLDPGKEADLDFEFRPLYKLGAGKVVVRAEYFDFSTRMKERLPLKGGELKIFYRKSNPTPMDEDSFRILTAKLKRWEVESDVIEIPPKDLFDELTSRAKGMGLHPLKPYEAPMLYRGIQRFAGESIDGHPILAQIQVIGRGEESKFLLYFWAETYREGYSAASRLLNKVKNREKIVSRILLKTPESG
ncbi:MAG: hypothetical protein J7L88_03010 [Thermoplasmata archaeon]|nr:hypothetical protein [Thermoplasmata archaeon]